MATIRKAARIFRFNASMPRDAKLSVYLPWVPCDYCGIPTLQGLMRKDDFGKRFCRRHPYGDRDHRIRR